MARSALLCRVVGAVLITLGASVAVAWGYLAFTEIDAESDFGDRVGAYVDTLALLVLGVIAGGVGCWLRLVADRTDVPGSWRSSAVAAVATLVVIALVPVAAILRADQRRDEQAAPRRVTAEEIERLSSALVDRRPPVVVPLPTATLTVHTDGCGVIRSEVPGSVGNLTWVVKDTDGFQVLGRVAENETRYRYFQPGTYTVVLQAHDGTRYVDISNEVTIHC